ncbi:hypothetical protein EDD11_000781 [Mortierella claussenii]|nr:hypothetical protein EDD11_000781 [Mortierella claussenii]
MRPSQFQLTGHTTLRRIGIFAPRRSNQPTLTPLAPEPRLTTSSSLISSASASSSSSSSSASSPISVRLCIHSSLRRNDSAWTPDQDSLLLDLRTQGRTWTEIGQVLHRSRQSCNRRFDSVLDPKNGAAFWNDHPDRIRLLKELVSQHLSWKVIAQQLGTNASSCKHQWKLLNQQEKLEAEEVKTRTTSLEPVMQFRADDQQLLKEAVEEYGTDQWQTISEKVFGPQYSPAYLRRQYTKLEQRRKVWTGQQEEALETAVTERYQSHRYSLSWDASGVDILSDEDWKVIAGSIAGEHTAAECREKWLRLQVTIMSLRTRTATPENDEGNNPPGQSSKPRASQGGSRVAWTEEESQQLESIINSIRADSKDALVEWDKVAKQMDNKFTRQQCKSRWNRVLRLNSGDSTGAWSEEEIENLLKGAR